MSAEQFSIVELDQVLAKDGDGRRVHQLQQMLVETAEGCRLLLDRGVAPDEAKRLSAMMAACNAGLGLLPTLWRTHQERN